MPPTAHRTRQPSPAVHYCYQCFLPQAATVQLKLCSGCRVAEYCSKECQKAAWPTHKKECGVTCKLAEATDPNLLDKVLHAFGFRTPVDSLKALNEFAQAHRWALEAHFHVAIRRKVGFKPAPGDITDSILVGNLECVAPPSSGKRLDPASRFRLRDRFKFVPLAEFKNASRERAEAFDRMYGESRATIQQFHGANLLFLGGCPVAYRIWPLSVVSFSCCPIFYAVHGPHNYDDDTRREIFEDKLRLATASINAGIVLRGVELRGHPVPGRLVRADKIWSFEPLFKADDWEDSWAAYLAADPRPKGVDLLDDAIARLKSGLPLLELIQVSQVL
ncbi:hypothetical protein GSI_07281 [Ganoderma sinense ZZ0214-1]|uniref:MYND-type domain-containing protein n=1 Tax=Ganoderma sinense ZZ0214-1 TaxID=1077348 RepID=A0A2G8SA12_9APHY|nr:hypothetical protein GSI_07281 [Ganoderma sinense ZZ0214-1]